MCSNDCSSLQRLRSDDCSFPEGSGFRKVAGLRRMPHTGEIRPPSRRMPHTVDTLTIFYTYIYNPLSWAVFFRTREKKMCDSTSSLEASELLETRPGCDGDGVAGGWRAGCDYSADDRRLDSTT